MTDFTTYRGIGQSISLRAGLMADLSSRLALLDQRDTVLKEQLLQKAPESLRAWLIDEGVLTMLFQYGKYDTKIYFNDEYVFKDIQDVKSMMKMLAKAWQDVVRIKVSDKPEALRVEVYLSAVL